MGKTEDLINYISERLQQANKENVLLKAQGKFSLEQASNTQKRMAEDIGSWVIKNIIRSDKTNKANNSQQESNSKNLVSFKPADTLRGYGGKE